MFFNSSITNIFPMYKYWPLLFPHFPLLDQKSLPKIEHNATWSKLLIKPQKLMAKFYPKKCFLYPYITTISPMYNHLPPLFPHFPSVDPQSLTKIEFNAIWSKLQTKQRNLRAIFNTKEQIVTWIISVRVWRILDFTVNEKRQGQEKGFLPGK